MSVPCEHPWTASQFGNDAIFTIEVGEGSEWKEFWAHVNLMAHCSGWFREELARVAEQNAEAEESKAPIIKLPDQCPDVFEVFRDVLYSGKLPLPETRRYPLGFVCKLYNFGKDFDIMMLRNTAVDALFERFADDMPDLEYNNIRYVWNNTNKHSAMSEMAVDVALNIGDSKALLRDYESSFSKAFLRTLLYTASDFGVVPFEHREDRVDWIERLRGQVCKRYHDHEGDESRRADEEADEDMEVDDGHEEGIGGVGWEMELSFR